MANGNAATINIPIWGLIVTLCLAVGSGAWAISAEIHNYRLQDITTRLKSQETRMLNLIAHDGEQDTMIERVSTLMTGIADDITEMKADLKVHLNNGHP